MCFLTTKLKHVRQHQRVCQSVWNPILTAKLVRNSVHITDIDLIDRKTGIVGPHSHTVTRIQILAVMIGSCQVIKNQLDRQARIL